MSRSHVRLTVWSSGAYACAVHDGRGDVRAMVQHDGRHTTRFVALTPDGFEETVSTRSTTRSGAVIRCSRLVGDSQGRLAWTWAVDRPSLRRRMTWNSKGGSRAWTQHDVRDDCEVRYEVGAPGRYRGRVHGLDGALLWTSQWERGEDAGWRGIYRTPAGEAAGEVVFSPAAPGRAGAPVPGIQGAPGIPGLGPAGSPGLGGLERGGLAGLPGAGRFGWGGRGGVGTEGRLGGSRFGDGLGIEGLGGVDIGGIDTGRGGPLGGGPSGWGGGRGIDGGPGGPGSGMPTFGGINTPGHGLPGVRWNGPGSRGAAGAGGVTIEGSGGNMTYTFDYGSGRSVQTGSRSGPGLSSSWINVSFPDGSGGTTSWESGTDRTNNDDENYTIVTARNADGSSQWTRTSTSSNGDKETAFGATDAQGNHSHSSSTTHADGSVTLVTRTLDRNRNGTEHTTTIAKDGSVMEDATFEVRDDRTVRPGSSDGGSSGGPGTGSSAASVDPNAPIHAGAVSAPDVQGMPTDAGGGCDAPWAPLGRLGIAYLRQLSELFGAIRNGEPGDDREGSDRAAQMIALLQEELRRGGVRPGGEPDDTGWGQGEPTARRVISADYVPPDESEDDLLNHPQALVAYVESLVRALGSVGASGNLLFAAGDA